MIRWLRWVWLAFLVSVPWWLDNAYYLHVLIMTGIFLERSLLVMKHEPYC